MVMALRTLTAKLTPSLPKIFNIKMSEQNILPFSSTTSHSVNFSKSRYVAHPLLNTNLLILLMRFLLYNPHAKVHNFIGTKESFYTEKNLQLSQYYFGTPTWPPFHED